MTSAFPLCFAVLSSGVFGQVLMNIAIVSSGDTANVTFRGARVAGPPVINAPYAGELVSEHVRTVAGGAQLAQTNEIQRVFRDSQGRTRTERPVMMASPVPQPGPVLIEVTDPVAGFAWIADDQSRTVHRVPIQPKPAAPDPGPPPKVPLVPLRDSSLQDVKSEKLGTQNIDGFLAEGTRTTMTWRAGSQGNDRPFSDTRETWFATELKTMVLSKYVSMRGGESTTRLTNISRAEPDPALFQPPQEYVIVDEEGSFSMTLKRP